MPELLRERIKKKDCLHNSAIFVKDFEILLRYWDKLNSITMLEITHKFLSNSGHIQALYQEYSQKNIIKIFLVRIYIGAELLSRVPIRKWSSNLDKELLNAIEAHIKEPFQIVYCQKPTLCIVLMIEFLNKLALLSNRYKNRCWMLSQRLMNLGGNFVKELKDEEELRFFVEQQDSQGRTALEIMSVYKFYPLLDSNEMATIIKEKWHGSNA